MTDVFKAINERRSRRRFTGKTVSYDQLKVIADAGLRAPTVNDLRDLQFVIVNDGRKINTVSDNANGQTWIRNAGGMIGVIANEARLASYHNEDTKKYTHEHAGAAMQNMLLATHALNLGGCWVEDYTATPVEKAFSAPPGNDFDTGEDESLIAVLVVGYPDGEPRDKPAYHPSNHIFIDEFEERLEHHRYMRGQFYEQLRKVGYNVQKDTQSILKSYTDLYNHIMDWFRQ